MTEEKKDVFSSELTKRDIIVGIVYLIFHAFFLGYVVMAAGKYAEQTFSIKLDDSWLNFCIYAISFVFVLVLFWRFLKTGYEKLTTRKGKTILNVIYGYVICLSLTYLLTLVLELLGVNLANVASYSNNQNRIIEMLSVNRGPIIAATAVLAPIVEETLFTGVVFGAIRGKNKALAYIIGIIIYVAYHYIGTSIETFDISILYSALFYIPNVIALEYTYEKSNNIWAPIFLHILMNTVSIISITNSL